MEIFRTKGNTRNDENLFPSAPTGWNAKTIRYLIVKSSFLGESSPSGSWILSWSDASRRRFPPSRIEGVMARLKFKGVCTCIDTRGRWSISLNQRNVAGDNRRDTDRYRAVGKLVTHRRTERNLFRLVAKEQVEIFHVFFIFLLRFSSLPTLWCFVLSIHVLNVRSPRSCLTKQRFDTLVITIVKVG